MKNNRRAVARDRVFTGVIALLLAGAALAQGTWEQLPNGNQNENTPALRGPDSSQTAQVGEMEVLNGPVSFHTRNYLSFGLLANIRPNWRRVLIEKGLISGSEQKAFAVEFTVLRDGTLDSKKLVESSGDAELDGTGLDAIAKSAPFTAIPADFSGESLRVRCHFYLNPGRRIRSVSRVAPGSADVADNTPTAGDVKVVKGLGSGLDESAIATVRTWKFKPGTEDGSPVKSEINVEVSFHLYN
jgi:TonB family protein